jgi:hypothetical protein
MGLPKRNKNNTPSSYLWITHVIIEQDKDDAEYMTKKLKEYRLWGLKVQIFKTEYLNVLSDIRDIKLEHNIGIMSSST